MKVIASTLPAGTLLRSLATTRPQGSLVDLACREGVAALVLDECDRLAIALSPPDRERLRSRAIETALTNLHASRQLPLIVAALGGAGIPSMLLKGAALTRTVYRRPELRPMSDVDLLVKGSDALRAVETLERAGCRRGASLIGEDFFPRFHYEVELFWNPANPLRVDLHARPFRPLPLSAWVDESTWWERAGEIALGDYSAFVPSPEVMLVHLCAHAAFHGFSRLLWLYDVRCWLARYGPGLEWEAIGRLCSRWRLTLAVKKALGRVEDLFGPCVPEEAWSCLRQSTVGIRESLILAQAPHDARRPIAHVCVNLLCTPGWQTKAGYLRAMLFPQTSHLNGIYPKRHPGWRIVAHLIRAVRALSRAWNSVRAKTWAGAA